MTPLVATGVGAGPTVGGEPQRLRPRGTPARHRDRLRPGQPLACPTCGAVDCPAYDTERITWRHLNFFQHEAYLHARVPRVRCDECGIKTVNVPSARPGSGITLLFEALVMTMVAAMPARRRPG